MTPAKAIAILDRQVTAHGEPIELRRGVTEVTVSGFVRGYKPEQIAGLIQQGDRQVALSPSALAGFEPRAQDDIKIGGRAGKVLDVEPVRIGSTVVRWNLRARVA